MTTLPELISTGALSTELRADIAHAAALAEQSISERSRKLYETEFASFAGWAEGHGLPALPTTAAIVATYLAHIHKQGRALSSAALIRAAIRHAHNRARIELDLDTPDMREIMKGFRAVNAKAGRTLNKAEPFTVEMWKVLSTVRPETAEDFRDVALIGLGIVRALRGPSELLALDLARRGRDPAGRGVFTFTPEGATLHFVSTKTHQIEGEVIEVIGGPALDAVRIWCGQGRIAPGTPLWRTIRKGAITGARMRQRTLHNVVQRRAEQVLLLTGASRDDAAARAQAFSTHSLRHGGLTSLGCNNGSVTEIMSLSRHRPSSVRIAMGYVKPENVGPRAMQKLGI